MRSYGLSTMDSIMRFEFAVDNIQNLHFHQEPEIIYILNGSVQVKIEAERYKLKTGDFLLVNANKNHEVSRIEKDTLIAQFYINLSMLSELLETNRLLFWCNSTNDRNDAYEKLRKALDRIVLHSQDREKEGKLYMTGICYEAVYILAAYFMIRADDDRIKEMMNPDSARIFDIQNYVQSNFHSQISLNDLAQKLDLSNAYLSKYIKKHFGMSFVDYVNNIRLLHAVDELIYTDKKITRIALDNGFPTAASFNKVFKEVYQITPSVYRSDINSSAGKAVDNVSESLMIEARVQKYLDEVKMPKKENIPNKIMTVSADLNNSEKMNMPWKEIINIGPVSGLLDSSVQRQILYMKEKVGFRYVRVQRIFTNEFYERQEGKYRYNFNRLDRAFDFLVENGMKPYIELSFKPLYLIYSPYSPLIEDTGNIVFKSQDAYRDVINDLALHLSIRYGTEEVETWYFELWKDDGLHMLDEKGAYFEWFEIGYHALKRISSKIKVGGAGFALGFDTYRYRSLIRNWKKRTIRPDFISMYSFSYKLIKENGMYYTKPSLDRDFLLNQLEIFKRVLKDEEFLLPEIHITEWNFTVSNRNCINDSCALGAYVMKICIDSIGNIDKLGYWHGSDLYSELYDSASVLYGDSGLLSRDGICKPTFYAFNFMNYLQPFLMEKSENAVVTTNRRGIYVIACHNYKPFNYRYNLKSEKELGYENLDTLYEDVDPLQISFDIKNVKNGIYIVRILYVNKNYGSIQDVWKKMGFIKNLSKDEIDYMKRCAVPRTEMRRIKVENHNLQIGAELMAHEIRLFDIRYQPADIENN